MKSMKLGSGRPMLLRLSLTLWTLLAVMVVAVGPAAAQDEAETPQAPHGVWMTEDEGSKVEIFSCDDALCGRVVWMLVDRDDDGNILTDIYNPDPALRTAPVLGLVIMTGIKPTEEENVWQGRVYNPQDGRSYDFWLTVKSESQITIQGCGLYNLICQTQTWNRAEL